MTEENQEVEAPNGRKLTPQTERTKMMEKDVRNAIETLMEHEGDGAKIYASLIYNLFLYVLHQEEMLMNIHREKLPPSTVAPSVPKGVQIGPSGIVIPK